MLKPETEQAKIDAHLEQQRRKAKTSPSGGAAAGATSFSCHYLNQERLADGASCGCIAGRMERALSSVYSVFRGPTVAVADTGKCGRRGI
jgi:hypothetical protein